MTIIIIDVKYPKIHTKVIVKRVDQFNSTFKYDQLSVKLQAFYIKIYFQKP